MPPLELEHSTANEILALSVKKTVIFFAVAPLEDHGPHLNLNLDLEEASELCKRAALRLEQEMPGWSGVLMPRLALGIDSNTSHLAIRVRAHVLRDALVDQCRSLMKLGFSHFVCFSGHLGPRQLTAIEEASRIVRRRGIASWGVRELVSANSALTTWQWVRAAPFRSNPPEHGGARDTSVALALGLPTREAATLQTRERPRSRWGREGYWGVPRDASRERGEAALVGTLDTVFPKLRAVWEGASPNALFRSWYSVLPPNKSFFKAWMLALALALVVAAWAYLSVSILTF